MRFMMMIKGDEQSEAGVTPDPKVFEAMGQFNQALIDSGSLLAADGLQPSSKGAKVKFHGGKPTVTDGPFAEVKELIAGYWIIQAQSKNEAVEWAKRCFRTVDEIAGPVGGDAGEIEVRQIFELEDFPVNEEESGWREAEAEQRQAGVPQLKPGYKLFMVMRMADKESEAGVVPSEGLLTAMGAYNEQFAREGLMLAGEGLQPSSKGAKVRYSKGKITVIDGPFTEAKELIAGFSVIQARSLAEVIEWMKQWPAEDGHGEVELRIRQVFGADDFDLPQGLKEQEERQRAQVAAQQDAGQQKR
jgi:hypothetical protein